MIKCSKKRQIAVLSFFLAVFYCGQNGYSMGSEVTVIVEAENTTSEKALKKVKYGLPREIGPEHVIDSSGLELLRDGSDGAYYLVGESEFEPYQTKRFSVRLVDVWKTPIPILEGYLREAEEIRDELKRTPYEDMAEALFRKIKYDTEEIISGQKPAVNMQDHIASARENEEKVAVIWEALDRLRGIRKEKSGNRAGSIDRETVETIILALVTFLIVITAIFWLIWTTNNRKTA